tara:strand:+ start:75 stop:491 length:417 start_codon:yes stop_codon:yes gene_type:complete
MNFFDVLLILLFIFLVMASIYKNIIIENFVNKENLSNELDIDFDNELDNELDDDSTPIKLNNNEISCCKMKEQENINYIENEIYKIKDMFKFFDKYENDIKENINYIKNKKDSLDEAINLTEVIKQKYNQEQENIKNE